MTFPATSHADQLAAFNDLINKATAAGYTSIDTDLGERGTVASILANMFADVVTDTIKAATTNGNLTLSVNGTGGITVGSGTAIKGIRVVSATLTPAAVAANTAVEQTFTTFSGLTTADTVSFIEKPTAQGGLAIVNVRVVAADNLGITFGNFTGSAITPTAGQVYKTVAIRS